MPVLSVLVSHAAKAILFDSILDVSDLTRNKFKWLLELLVVGIEPAKSWLQGNHGNQYTSTLG